MKFYTVNQAAEAAGVAHTTAARWAKKKGIEKKGMPMSGEQYAIPEAQFGAFVDFLKTRRGNRTPLGKGEPSSKARRKVELRDAIRRLRGAE